MYHTLSSLFFHMDWFHLPWFLFLSLLVSPDSAMLNVSPSIQPIQPHTLHLEIIKSHLRILAHARYDEGTKLCCTTESVSEARNHQTKEQSYNGRVVTVQGSYACQMHNANHCTCILWCTLLSIYS